MDKKKIGAGFAGALQKAADVAKVVYDKSKANFNSYKEAFAKLGYTIKKK